MAAKTQHQSLSVPADVQRAILGMIAVAWLGVAALTIGTIAGADSVRFSWGVIIWTIAYPLIFFITALAYAWREYPSLLQKIFVAAILAGSGLAAALLISRILYILYIKLNFLGAGTYSYSSSLQGIDWAVLLVGFLAYGAVIFLLHRNKKKVN